MRVLFVCNICDISRHNLVSGYQTAAMLWQQKLLSGFEKIPGVKVDLLSTPLIPSFSPSYRTLFSKAYTWSHNGTSRNACVSFLNIFPVRNIFMQYKFHRYMKKWIKTHRDEEICVISYSPRIPFISTAGLASINGVNGCGIIPDLPEYAGVSKMRNPLYRFMKKYDIKAFYKWAKNVDSFVLFSKWMEEKFTHEIKNIVIECICEETAFPDTLKTSETNEKHIVYSGGIENAYGVELLLEAFSQIKDKHYRLDLCGSGSDVQAVMDYVEKDSRITYHGLVSHEKVIEIQRNATILVNPRTSAGGFTKYSFPSKNAEYLQSGKPVLCFKLEGIPDEYDDYFIYFESRESEKMAKTIIQTCELPEKDRLNIGIKGRQFIMDNKNSLVQAKRILRLIESNKR